jgi:hypothetical protein
MWTLGDRAQRAVSRIHPSRTGVKCRTLTSMGGLWGAAVESSWAQPRLACCPPRVMGPAPYFFDNYLWFLCHLRWLIVES